MEAQKNRHAEMFADEERGVPSRGSDGASAGNEEAGLMGEGNSINIQHIGGVIESSEVHRLSRSRRDVFHRIK